MPYDASLLAGLTTLHGLNGSELEAFLGACVPARVPADLLLMKRDDLDRSMLFVREGEVEVYLGQGSDRVVVRELRRGDHVGASNLLGLSSRRSATVRSLTPATLLILERDGFEQLVRAGNPVVKNLEAEVLQDLVGDLGEILETLRGLARGRPLPQPAPPPPAPGLLSRLVASLRGPEDTSDCLGGREPPTRLSSVPRWLVGPHEFLEAAPGTMLLEAGGERKDPFFLLDGLVGRHLPSRSGGHILLGHVRAGQLGAFESAVDSTWRSTTYVAEEHCRLLRVPYDLCADSVVMRGPPYSSLRRVMLETTSRWHDDARRMLFRGLAHSLGRRSVEGLSQHPGYRHACSLTARRA